ncbi:hypothetical protein Ancab_034854 [Ancistrocladus abbreviatus]
MEAQEGNSSDIRRPETEVGSANASNTSNFIEDFNDVPSNQGDFDHSAIDPSVRPSKKNVLVENSIFFADRWSSKQEFGFPCLEIEDCDGLSIMAAALLKRPRTPPSMLVVASGLSDYDKLWKTPPNRDYAPCIEPSPFYTTPAESHGYLLVHTNGGLNQMWARDEDYLTQIYWHPDKSKIINLMQKAAENLNFDASEPVVILGFGQMGQVLANFLSAPLASGGDGDGVGWPYVAFDLNPAVVKVRVGDLVGFRSKSTTAPKDNLSEPNHTKQEAEIAESEDTEEQVVLHCEMGKDNSSKEKSEEAQESDSLPINYS